MYGLQPDLRFSHLRKQESEDSNNLRLEDARHVPGFYELDESAVALQHFFVLQKLLGHFFVDDLETNLASIFMAAVLKSEMFVIIDKLFFFLVKWSSFLLNSLT